MTVTSQLPLELSVVTYSANVDRRSAAFLDYDMFEGLVKVAVLFDLSLLI